MIGAIVGDIVGSRFEWDNRKSKTFTLFTKNCFFTDDTVMTLAIAKALMMAKGNIEILAEKTIMYMRQLGNKYPDCGYGGHFLSWLFAAKPQPYNSYGNGSAMRVSPCGIIASSLEEARLLSLKVTEVTHNHEEGIKGAEAVAVAIYLARNKASISEIEKYINEHYYNLQFSLADIRPDYCFDVSCQGSVPQAIKAFTESHDFEDAIRNAISIGGDSDTIAAITGSIAEAYYGVPPKIRETALTYLDSELLHIVEQFETYCKALNQS